MIVGSLAGVAIMKRVEVRTLLWSVLVGIGGCIVLLAIQRSYNPALVVISAIGVLVALLPLAIGPLIMRSTRVEFMGRVSALISPIMNGATVIGLGLGGFLYGYLGDGNRIPVIDLQVNPLTLIFTGAGLLCISAGVLLRQLFMREQSLNTSPVVE